jgi:hypothetical protein
MKRIVLLVSVLAVVGTCFWFSNVRPAHAAGGTDTWTVGPNCVGVTNTPQHICEFLHTQLLIGASRDPFDQWDLIVIEPGTITSISCQTMGTNIFQYRGAIPDRPGWGHSMANPWDGSHYGNVGVCKGWINGGNGPVKVTAIYQ